MEETFQIIKGEPILFFRNWKLLLNNIVFINKENYEFEFILYCFENDKWTLKTTLTVKYNINNYKEIYKMSSFGLIIKSIIVNLNFKFELTIKLFRYSKLNLSTNPHVIILDSDDDSFEENIEENKNKRKREEIIVLSDEDTISEEEYKNINKKQKKELTKFRYLFFAVYHDENENFLRKKLEKSLIEYIQYYNQKSFLVLWENYANKLVPVLNINELNGKNSNSFKVPAESQLIAGFSFFESSVILFLFPIKYNERTNSPIYENDINIEITSKILNIVNSYHGETVEMNKERLKKYGYNFPHGIFFSWTFIATLLTAIIDNNWDLNFLKVLFKDDNKILYFKDNLIQFLFKLIKNNSNEFINVINEVVKQLILINNLEDNENTKNNLLELLLLDEEYLFKTPYHILLVKQILIYFNFSNVALDLRNFIIETFGLILSNINNINDLNFSKQPEDLTINYYDLNDYNIDNNQISGEYFSKIIQNLNKKLKIDLPTSIFLKYFYNISQNGIYILPEQLGNMFSYFEELRNLITIEHTIELYKKTKIENFIIFYGNGHIDHLIESTLHYKKHEIINSKNEIYTSYNNNKLNFLTEIEKEFVTAQFISFLEDIKKLLIYYLELEFIDYWFYDINNNKQSSNLIFESKKLQYYSELHQKFNEVNDLEFSKEKEIEIINNIGIFLSLIYLTNTPTNFDKLIGNDLTYLRLTNESQFYPFIQKYIGKDNLQYLKIVYNRKIGVFFKKFEVENFIIKYYGDFNQFINKLMESINNKITVII